VSPEFRLLMACVAPAAPHGDLPSSIDGPCFLALVARHRLAGPVMRALRTEGGGAGIEAARDVIDSVTRQSLARMAGRQARTALTLAGESLRLTRSLTAAGLAVVVLKGTPLAWMAYGDLGCRHSRDVDLLVPPEQLDWALEHLATLGYDFEHPEWEKDPHFRAFLRTRDHHVELRHREGGQLVELHWRFGANPHDPFAVPDPASWRVSELSPGLRLPTLAFEDHLLYLFHHGARHGWMRLKWLLDLHLLLRGSTAEELRALAARAEGQRVLRPVAQGLLLAQEWFALPLPEDLRAAWLKDRAIRKLVDLGRKIVGPDLSGSPASSGPLAASRQQARIRRANYLLHPGWAYRLAEIRYDLSGIEDRLILPLPRRLQGLYPLLRLPLWLFRRLGGGKRKPQA